MATSIIDRKSGYKIDIKCNFGFKNLKGGLQDAFTDNVKVENTASPAVASTEPSREFTYDNWPILLCGTLSEQVFQKEGLNDVKWTHVSDKVVKLTVPKDMDLNHFHQKMEEIRNFKFETLDYIKDEGIREYYQAKPYQAQATLNEEFVDFERKDMFIQYILAVDDDVYLVTDKTSDNITEFLKVVYTSQNIMYKDAEGYKRAMEVVNKLSIEYPDVLVKQFPKDSIIQLYGPNESPIEFIKNYNSQSRRTSARFLQTKI